MIVMSKPHILRKEIIAAELIRDVAIPTCSGVKVRATTNQNANARMAPPTLLELRNKLLRTSLSPPLEKTRRRRATGRPLDSTRGTKCGTLAPFVRNGAARPNRASTAAWREPDRTAFWPAMLAVCPFIG